MGMVSNRRRCHKCKHEFDCRDNILPECQCPKCLSADTRPMVPPREEIICGADECAEPISTIEPDSHYCKQHMHNHIERNGIQIKYGETVLVEVDKVSPLLADRIAWKLDLALLAMVQVEQSQEQLPYFVEMTYSPELLSYHNWRNRIVAVLGEENSSISYAYRLHRISYNEFAWIKLEPLNIVEFKEQFAGMRKPYDWEQIFGLRVKPECLKAMGMPREESNMRPITVTEFFQAVGSLRNGEVLSKRDKQETHKEMEQSNSSID